MSSTREPDSIGNDHPARVRHESRTSRYVKWSELKERVNFRDILEYYDVLRYMDEKHDGALKGPCPIHDPKLQEEVDYRMSQSGSFKVTPSLMGFKCFGCDARGSIIDFVAAKEECSPTYAGQLIDGWFPKAGTSSRKADDERETGDVELEALRDEVLGPPALAPQTSEEDYRERLATGVPLYTTRLVRQTTLEASAFDQCRTPADLVSFLQHYFRDHDREEFLVLLFNTAMRLTGLVSASIGGRNASIVEPAQVFKAAILGNADSVILAHNHPSGSVEPSRADVAITRQLLDAGEIMGIPVRDHLIIAERSYTSLGERSLMPVSEPQR